MEQPQKGKSLIEAFPALEVECEYKILHGIVDSGTQIPIIRSGCEPEYSLNPGGTLEPYGPFERQLKALLKKCAIDLSSC